MTPFMKAKLRKKFVVCSNEEAQVHVGGAHMMPVSLGGTGAELQLHDLLTMFPVLGDVDLRPTPGLDALEI
jgi:hypothetical protein